MGYYTRFKLTVVEEDEINKNWGIDYKEQLQKLSPYKPSFEESCTWYDHEDDMKKLSKKFSTVLFMLHGQGEDNEDMWNKYFLNGKMQVCKAEIVYPPLDKNLLA